MSRSTFGGEAVLLSVLCIQKAGLSCCTPDLIAQVHPVLISFICLQWTGVYKAPIDLLTLSSEINGPALPRLEKFVSDNRTVKGLAVQYEMRVGRSDILAGEAASFWGDSRAIGASKERLTGALS